MVEMVDGDCAFGEWRKLILVNLQVVVDDGDNFRW